MAKSPQSQIGSDRLIADLPSPAKGQRIFYDGAIPGFGVRVTTAGAKTFVLNYRVRGTGKERRFSIGSTDSWKVAAARKEAERLRKVVDLGGDPLGDIEQERKLALAEKLRGKTVADLCDRFESEHLPALRPATRKFYRLALKNHVRPSLGKKRVEDVLRADVEKLQQRDAKALLQKQEETVERARSTVSAAERKLADASVALEAALSRLAETDLSTMEANLTASHDARFKEANARETLQIARQNLTTLQNGLVDYAREVRNAGERIHQAAVDVLYTNVDNMIGQAEVTFRAWTEAKAGLIAIMSLDNSVLVTDRHRRLELAVSDVYVDSSVAEQLESPWLDAFAQLQHDADAELPMPVR